MDESLQELEAELKSLRLPRPAPSLCDRIGRDLAESESAAPVSPRYTAATNLNTWKWLGWRTAGVAAAVALVVAVSWMNLEEVAPASVTPLEKQAGTTPIRPAPAGRAPSTDRYQPVAAANVLYDLEDEGPVYVDGSTPARRLRYRYLDTYTWKNPRNNASLKWSVPRDEIRVLPASLN
jgi:hypothetical protein